MFCWRLILSMFGLVFGMCFWMFFFPPPPGPSVHSNGFSMPTTHHSSVRCAAEGKSLKIVVVVFLWVLWSVLLFLAINWHNKATKRSTCRVPFWDQLPMLLLLSLSWEANFGEPWSGWGDGWGFFCWGSFSLILFFLFGWIDCFIMVFAWLSRFLIRLCSVLQLVESISHHGFVISPILSPSRLGIDAFGSFVPCEDLWVCARPCNLLKIAHIRRDWLGVSGLASFVQTGLEISLKTVAIAWLLGELQQSCLGLMEVCIQDSYSRLSIADLEPPLGLKRCCNRNHWNFRATKVEPLKSTESYPL